jgi:hypothetical protein
VVRAQAEGWPTRAHHMRRATASTQRPRRSQRSQSNLSFLGDLRELCDPCAEPSAVTGE